MKYLILLVVLLMPVATMAEQKLEIAISTPSPCKGLHITKVYEADGKVLVVAHVSHEKPNMMCPMMIGRATAAVPVNVAKSKEVQAVIIGKDWCWQRPDEAQGYHYVQSQQQSDALTEGMTEIFSQDLPKGLTLKVRGGDKHCKKSTRMSNRHKTEQGG